MMSSRQGRGSKAGCVKQVVLLALLLVVLVVMIIWLIPTATTFYHEVISEPGTSTTSTGAPQKPTTPGVPGEDLLRTLNPEQLLLVLGSGCLLIAAIITLVMRPVKLGGRKAGRESSRHGSAQFASKDEIKKRYTLGFWEHQKQRREQKQNGMPIPSRLLLGYYQGIPVSLSEHQQEQNILLTAPIGSGKSSLVIIPNILRERGARSLFIPDVKGELYRVTAGAVAEYHTVWRFAPMQPEAGHSYNPLAYVQSVEDAQELATCWVLNTGQSKDAFWTNIARQVMTMVLLHLKESEPSAAFERVADIICRSTYEELKETLAKSDSQQVQRESLTFFAYVEQNERILGSLMTDLNSRFQLLLSDQVRRATRSNDIDFSAMADNAVALYLSIPRRGAERLQPLLACFVSQMFGEWEKRAEGEPDGRLPWGIMCYLDEFANLGYIPSFSSYISTARASGVAMLIALQSFSQLEDRYSEQVKRNILANTVTHLLLPGAGLDECKYYSERLGETTIQTENYSESTSKRDEYLWSLSGTGTTGNSQGEAQRRLMTPDEIRRLKPGTMLMLVASLSPIITEPIPYYQDKELASKANQPYTIERPEEKETLQWWNAPTHPGGLFGRRILPPVPLVSEFDEIRLRNDVEFVTPIVIEQDIPLEEATEMSSPEEREEERNKQYEFPDE